jgi:hypothetical protein
MKLLAAARIPDLYHRVASTTDRGKQFCLLHNQLTDQRGHMVGDTVQASDQIKKLRAHWYY